MSSPRPDWPQSHTTSATIDRSDPFSDLGGARKQTTTARNPYDDLDNASRILRFTAYVVAFVGVIGGIFVATITDGSNDSIPYLGVGIGLAFSNVVFAAVLYWMSSFGIAWVNNNDPLS